jgi:predicted transcriptional regulator
MKTAKQELSELLDRMPDDAPMDTLLAEMHFKASVLRGLEQADRGEGISHDEVKERLRAWRTSPGRQKLFGS